MVRPMFAERNGLEKESRKYEARKLQAEELRVTGTRASTRQLNNVRQF
jgi:hypothetical protein